jgi:hypothetical protein
METGPQILRLFEGAIEYTCVNINLHILSRLTVDCASDRERSSQNLLQSSLESSGLRLESHGSGDVENLIAGEVTVVLDVLGLLAISEGLLELLNDERSIVRNEFDGSLSVLNGQLSCNSDTFPVHGSLLDVFSNLLWRHTKWTDLRGKDGRGTDFTTVLADVHNLNFSGVWLWWHKAEK